MLVVGVVFLAWALLRPLTLDTAVEGQAEGIDHTIGSEELARRRAAAH